MTYLDGANPSQLEQLLKRRASSTRSGPVALGEHELRALLWAAFGRISDDDDDDQAVPSTKPHGGSRGTTPRVGGLTAVQGFVVLSDGVGSQGSVSQYDPTTNLRRELHTCVNKLQINEQNWLLASSATILFAARLQALTQFYGAESAREGVLLEIGHKAQNLILRGVELGLRCGICAVSDPSLLKNVSGDNDLETLYAVSISERVP